MNPLISFTCEHCQATLSIPAELAGISGPCPYCARTITSPSAPDASPGGNPAENIIPSPPPGPDYPEEAPGVSPGHKRAAAAVVAVLGLLIAYRACSKPAPEPARERDRPVPAEAEKPVPAAPVEAPPPEPVPPEPTEPALSPAAAEPEIPTPKPAPKAEVIPEEEGAAPAPAETAPAPGAGESPPKPEPAEPALSPAAAEQEIRKVVATAGHLEKPGNALVGFFAAPTWQQRLRYTLAPEKMRPLMEAYYAVHPDGPVIPDSVELSHIEGIEDDSKRSYFVYLAYLPGLNRAVPLSVEETKEGCRVEWGSYIESKDRMLAAFYARPESAPREFRALVRRGHYFEKDVPGQSSKLVLDLRAPDGAGPWKAWMDKNSKAYKQYFASGELARWDVTSMMIVALEWEKSGGSSPYVRLREVVANTWHPDLLPAARTP